MRPPVPITADHAVDAFDSGEPALDDWLRRSALDAQRRGTARTFVLVDGGRVVGYYALAAHLLQRDELPGRVARGNPAQIPAALLARLALDREYQVNGLGGAILVDALRRVVAATQDLAARYVVVDALHERAASFYQAHGFVRVPGALRLVRKVSDVAADLDA